MKIFKFLIKSYVFKRIILISFIFLVLIFYGVNKLFDSIWTNQASIPLLDLEYVYKPPRNYDNFKKLNVKIINKTKFGIESNKVFKIAGHQKNYDYYDTTDIQFPGETSDITNKIFIEYPDTKDSIFLVIAKAIEKDIFWNQIFLSTVIIEKLNEFSDNPAEFRVNENTLVEQPLLDNNDTLIYKVLNYFEMYKEKLQLGDCGANSAVFRDICTKFNLPCRPVGLQGGDAVKEGYNNYVGYPAHAMCEIYSSKYKKWYVIDPTYGLRFRNAGTEDYLNAIEISNMLFFHREKFIIQDSVLSTKRTMLGRDYFKYYENIYFLKNEKVKEPLSTVLRVFFSKFGYNSYHYTNHLIPLNNGFYYFGTKFFVYILLIILYFNVVLTLMTRRLFSAKKPNHFINDGKHFYKKKQTQQA